MWWLNLGQTVMWNPGHFWQLMKTELICAIVMIYLWVGRNLGEERAEHGSLGNDRLLSLTFVCGCLCFLSSLLCWFFSLLYPPAKPFTSLCWGVKCCIINIKISLQKRKCVWFTHRAVLKRSVCVSKDYKGFDPKLFCTEMYRLFLFGLICSWI